MFNDLEALAATEHLTSVVARLDVQVEALTAELRDMGQAVERAMSATNDRMAAIDFLLFEANGTDPAPASEALTHLRRLLRRPAGSP